MNVLRCVWFVSIFTCFHLFYKYFYHYFWALLSVFLCLSAPWLPFIPYLTFSYISSTLLQLILLLERFYSRTRLTCWPSPLSYSCPTHSTHLSIYVSDKEDLVDFRTGQYHKCRAISKLRVWFICYHHYSELMSNWNVNISDSPQECLCHTLILVKVVFTAKLVSIYPVLSFVGEIPL